MNRYTPSSSLNIPENPGGEYNEQFFILQRHEGEGVWLEQKGLYHIYEEGQLFVPWY